MLKFDNYTYFERHEQEQLRRGIILECDDEFNEDDEWDDEEYYD